MTDDADDPGDGDPAGGGVDPADEDPADTGAEADGDPADADGDPANIGAEADGDPADAGGDPADADGDPDGPASPAARVGGYAAGLRARAGGYARALRRDYRESRTFRAIVWITVAALVMRLLLLGQRAAHWDEGRVAYWVVRYAESGVFEYRAIVHGPFFFQVNKWLFWAFGPSDFVMRLPVAVIGGVLPLSAWLFRDRLKDAEAVALALLLAFTPLLVYYSRFMRNDVVVAAAMFLALALFVRALDSGRTAYLYAGTAFAAVGFTAKENAVVYVVCWLGALALLLDHRLFVGGDPGATGTDPRTDGGTGDGDLAADAATAGGTAGATVDSAWERRLDAYVDDALTAVGNWWLPVVIAGVEFLAILVFFYAPRGGGYAYDGTDPGLWAAVLDPRLLPAMLDAALVESFDEMVAVWVNTSKDISFPEYVDLVENLLHTVRSTAGVVGLFGVAGFLFDRWSDEGPRDLVSLASYWGFVSVFGYPYATDIWAPWVVVHVVVPLAVPAAVGLAVVYAWGREAARRRQPVPVALVALVLLFAAVPTAVTAVDLAYVNADSEQRLMGDAVGWSEGSNPNQRALQWAQPSNGLKGSLGEVRSIAAANDGTDVLFVGSTNPASGQNHFYVPDDDVCTRQPPVHVPTETCNDPKYLDWHSRLPLPWYMAAYDAEVDSSHPERTERALSGDVPPVVIAYGWDYERVNRMLPDDYEAHRHEFKLWAEDVVVFIDEDAPGR